MSFLSKLKEAFSKKEDKAQYLAGFQKTNETFGDALSKMEYEFHGCDDDFLEQFNTFSIYEILPQLIELWGLNTATQVESKKNIARLTDR